MFARLLWVSAWPGERKREVSATGRLGPAGGCCAVADAATVNKIDPRRSVPESATFS